MQKHLIHFLNTEDEENQVVVVEEKPNPSRASQLLDGASRRLSIRANLCLPRGYMTPKEAAPATIYTAGIHTEGATSRKASWELILRENLAMKLIF